jgi:Rrf2 family cysteine metabolism transcriptional repressor
MMRMSTKGHHAVRIMVYLALSPGRPITKAEIGDAENISPGYIQQLMGRLTSAGLVKSHRGKEGGFSLARSAADITVREVLGVTEGPFEIAECATQQDLCTRTATCPVNPLWVEVTNMVNALFDRTTIASLAARVEALALTAVRSPE